MRGWLWLAVRELQPQNTHFPLCTKQLHSRDSCEDLLHKKPMRTQTIKVQRWRAPHLPQLRKSVLTAEAYTAYTASSWGLHLSHSPITPPFMNHTPLHHSPFNTCVTSASSFRNWASEELSSLSVSSVSSEETQLSSCWDNSASSSKNCLAASWKRKEAPNKFSARLIHYCYN